MVLDYRGKDMLCRIVLLFMGNKQFEKRFNITKKQLLGKYNYQRDMEENNRARNI